jgi:ubiquinone/menaquinone biosynthesis C-methylase UbiE
MSEPSPPHAGFSDVDREESPEAYIRCLDLQHAAAFKQLYKRRVRELLALAPGTHVLDVGSGVGLDALEMARQVAPDGEVVGLDFSQTMVEKARRRTRGAGAPVRFERGDVQALPFADSTFDRAYADRTFQHLADPRRALAEMARVTRPGGLLLIVDPDHDTRVIASPYPDVTRRFLRFRASGIRQPEIAHQLYTLFQEAGMREVTVEALTEVATDYPAINAAMSFDGGMRLAAEHGVVTTDEAEAWIAAVEAEASAGRFLCAVTYFITLGRKAS